MESGDLATWVSAVGTIAAVVVALGLARRDRTAQHQRDERSQADLITAWISENEGAMSSLATTFAIQNSSTQSAYEVIVSLVAVQGAFRETGEKGEGYRCFVGQLPPGRSVGVIENGGNGMHLVLGVEIAFRDAAGNIWRRRGNGVLDSLSVGPAEFYGEGAPIPWGEASHAGSALSANRKYTFRAAHLDQS